MHTAGTDGRVTVRRCADRRAAELCALVLSARGIESRLVPEGGALSVQVAPADAARAVYELTEHDLENSPAAPEAAAPRLGLPPFEAVLAYWAVLLFFFAATRWQAFGIDWLEAGAADAGAMRAGEWWRAATALCLHVDAAHLLGNLVFGTVFALLLARVTGTGLAWLAMIVAGTLGNILNAVVQPAAHVSIGASTALFAAIGLLAALNQSGRPGRHAVTLRAGAPLAGGIMLLAFLGFAGERTDILAHVLGFGAGVAGGYLLARHGRAWMAVPEPQWRPAVAAAAFLAAAWTVAILA
jgi:membrane associated rhomboid family serine protease